MTARRVSRRVAGGAKRSRMHDGKPSWQDPELPQQYKQGWVEFYKLKFKVTPDVLIPRPETELLVDEVLDFVNNLHPKPYSLTILDLGTGSGNIAISLAKNLSRSDKLCLSHPITRFGYAPGVTILATDISRKALKVAKQNAKLHGVEKQITFIQSNLLGTKNTQWRKNGPPDVIVTNLPYIPSARIPYLDSSVKDFEPKIALNGGRDGFELYRKLFAQIKKLGWHPALMVFEIDYTHGELAINEAQKYFPKARIEVKTDLSHKQRILLIKATGWEAPEELP
mgnify:CR=1 FL=1